MVQKLQYYFQRAFWHYCDMVAWQKEHYFKKRCQNLQESLILLVNGENANDSSNLLEIIGFYERIVIIAVQETSNTYSFRIIFKFYTRIIQSSFSNCKDIISFKSLLIKVE